MNPNESNRTIDERLEFLLHSTESLHASTQELHATARLHAEQLAEDAKKWRVLERVLRAALEAGLNGDGEGNGE